MQSCYRQRSQRKAAKAVRPLRTSWHHLGAKVNSRIHPLPSTSAIKINPINFHRNWILAQLCHSSPFLLEKGHIKSVLLISAPDITWHQMTCSGSKRPNRFVRSRISLHKIGESSWFRTAAESLFLADFICSKSIVQNMVDLLKKMQISSF